MKLMIIILVGKVIIIIAFYISLLIILIEIHELCRLIAVFQSIFLIKKIGENSFFAVQFNSYVTPSLVVYSNLEIKISLKYSNFKFSSEICRLWALLL